MYTFFFQFLVIIDKFSTVTIIYHVTPSNIYNFLIFQTYLFHYSPTLRKMTDVKNTLFALFFLLSQKHDCSKKSWFTLYYRTIIYKNYAKMSPPISLVVVAPDVTKTNSGI